VKLIKIISSYKVKIKNYNHIFKETIWLYRNAVSYFINVCEREWKLIAELNGKKRNNFIEKLTIRTAKNTNPKYDFGFSYYKFPSYLRRAAIQEALGCYSSFHSNLLNWESAGKSGKPPKLTLDRGVMPSLYKDNMFVRVDNCEAKIKIFHKNDWVWLNVTLREQDVKYIQSHCRNRKELIPTIKRCGKQWYLVFPYEEKVSLSTTKPKERIICAVDLGLNNHATCSILTSNGTVMGRKFINFPIEKDHLEKAVNRIKKAQQKGNRKTPIKWKHAKDINTEISRKIAKSIVDFAILYSADVIVFEYLDFQGKKRGSKKQKLHLWRKREIQDIVEHNAHRHGMRLSRVNAWNTSRLAYDGTGRVVRGKEFSEKASYSVCQFQTGKMYNSDLNASYNIGARYFVRELLKSEPVMARLPEETKVSLFGTGTTRTLSTLIRLNAELAAKCR